MRMQVQILTPGVEHGEESDVSAQEPGIGGGFEQCARRRPEQNRVNLFTVLKRQAADLLRQREDHVEIGNGQKLGFSLREPPGARRSLALGTMPVAARVI
jgi:hypothetical protein